MKNFTNKKSLKNIEVKISQLIVKMLHRIRKT